MRGCLKFFAAFVLIAALALVLLVVFYFGIPIRGWGSNAERTAGPIPITPAWALEPWVWEDDVNTGAYVRELLDGYREHDIPARTILIDSPWSTRYNDFHVDEQRYPNPKEFFGKLEADGYRVVLWMTSAVCELSKDTAIQDSADWYNMAKEKGYLLNKGKSTKWWKGKGGFIDYRNPEGMQWWRGMQQEVFDLGIDGWKLDGAEVYAFNSLGPLPFPWLKSHDGTITLRQYTDDYYTREYEHGLTQNPEFITLARSIDNGPIESARQGIARDMPGFIANLIPHTHPHGFAPLKAAPVTWVGDNKHEWAEADEGIEEALRDILEAARQGYGVIGSDVAGYTGGYEIPPNIYIRWAQFSTFCGLFLNGGHGERRLWVRSPLEFELVRKAAWLHTELVPYIYRAIVEQHNGGPRLMRPTEHGYEYEFGPAFFVAPIHEDSQQRTFTLPAGKWRYWYGDKELIEGGQTITKNFPMEEFPVYVREGSIIPMKISRDYTGIGQRDWEPFLTLNLYPGAEGESSHYTYHHTSGSGATQVDMVHEGETLKVEVKGAEEPVLLRVRLDKAPAFVTLTAPGNPANGFTYTDGHAVIRCPTIVPELSYEVRF